jgi:hypothetical protein
MSWWKFWDRKPKHPSRLKSPPEPKSENDHSQNWCDNLTEYEIHYMTYSMFHEKVPNCPDCRQGFLLIRPRRRLQC